MAPESPPSATTTRVERVPPHSEEAERGVLGSVLLDADKVMDLCIERQLVPESFYAPAHRVIFDALLTMSRDGRPIDLLTLGERLTAAGLLERVGGALALERLVDATPTAAHAEYYIEIVRQKHLLRAIIEQAREAERACFTSDENADAVLGRVEQSFFEITERQHGLMRAWPDVVMDFMGQVEKHAADRPSVVGVPTGFRDLDETLLGLQKGNMIIIAARPSMGKTSLAMNIVENAALGEGPDHLARAVGIFSLEMSSLDLVKRMICSRARVSSRTVMRGFASPDQHRKLVQAADALTKAAIYLDDTAGLDITELRARARRMKVKHNVDLIVIDYLQLLHANEYARQGRQVEITAVSGGLKAMAKELHLPILVISQLSRAPERREKSESPKLSDLRDSGSIEQDADVVMFLRRPAMIAGDEQHEDDTLAIVDIAKHRNGPTAEDIRMHFDAEFTCFRDAAHGVDEAALRSRESEGGLP